MRGSMLAGLLIALPLAAHAKVLAPTDGSCPGAWLKSRNETGQHHLRRHLLGREHG